MKKKISGLIVVVLCILLQAPVSDLSAQNRQLYIPAKTFNVPEGNNFDDPESEFSYARMVQSDQVAILWAKEYGKDPMANPNADKRFDVQAILKECDRFYDYYTHVLKFVHPGNSVSDKYKVVFIIIGGEEGTAFGGGSEDVGMLWASAQRIKNAPYAALAHEMGHSFQYLLQRDGGRGTRSALVEMTAQYMLWQVYPEWMTFENYHLVSLREKTHLAFLHPGNMYHDPYVLEYWSGKHGKDFVGRLWRDGLEGEDPVRTYQRLTSIDQGQFNAELYDAYTRFITWDMDRIRDVAKPYANGHKSTLVPTGSGWYRIHTEKCPQNYGYNGIKLQTPASGTEVTLEFKGIAGSEGFSQSSLDKAGWRYGFVVHKTDGSRVYSPMYKNQTGTYRFKVPSDTEHLWLVVMGAPSEHIPLAMGMGRGNQGNQKEPEQWPYEIRLEGTSLDPGFILSP